MRPIPLALLALLCLTAAASPAAEPVTIAVDPLHPGPRISPDALGLSFETSLMLPDDHGVRYFRPGNRPLVALFRTLGVHSLRIGGNSVDAPGIPVPSPADVASLFEFAKAAGVKVIYSVRLENGDPASAAQLAKQIHDHFADTLQSFAIGNEPGYYKDYDVYRAKWTAIRDAIVSVFPEARFCGPDQNPSPELCRRMAHDFGAPSGRLVQITVHSYPFGCAFRNPSQRDVTKLIPVDPAAAREKMLSPAAYATYEKIRQGIAEAVSGTPLSFRLTETNSFWYSGLAGASDRYASALWAADYLGWWTSHGAAGLNFHTGDRTGGAVSLPCRYSAFVSSPNGYEVRPLAYGMKLFALGSQGRVLPVAVPSSAEAQLAAYAVLADDHAILVTIINKDHGAGAAGTDVQVKLGGPSAPAKAQAIFLRAANGDIAADSSAVTLGGAPIGQDGAWNGRWTPLPPAPDPHTLTIPMPPASAAVIRLR